MHRFEPVVHPERKKQGIPWRQSLQWGGLPAVLLSENPANDLYDYIDVYLNEEIKAEALVRSRPAFTRFLEIAATINTEQVVYDTIASDVGNISAVTIKEYFQILEDTLVGDRLNAFQKTKKRKPVSAPKFYFFDTGIANVLLKRRDIMEKIPEYGQALEHLMGIRAFNQEPGMKIIHSIVVCNESSPRTTPDGIQIMPVENFLDFLWALD